MQLPEGLASLLPQGQVRDASLNTPAYKARTRAEIRSGLWAASLRPGPGLLPKGREPVAVSSSLAPLAPALPFPEEQPPATASPQLWWERTQPFVRNAV